MIKIFVADGNWQMSSYITNSLLEDKKNNKHNIANFKKNDSNVFIINSTIYHKNRRISVTFLSKSGIKTLILNF